MVAESAPGAVQALDLTERAQVRLRLARVKVRIRVLAAESRNIRVRAELDRVSMANLPFPIHLYRTAIRFTYRALVAAMGANPMSQGDLEAPARIED